GDPNKYRFVHVGLRELLKDYTDDLFPKSIDEFVLNLKDYVMASLIYGARPSHQEVKNIMLALGKEIKKKIRQEIGDWISVSIGIGPSRFIAKTASNYEKPDGLVVID